MQAHGDVWRKVNKEKEEVGRGNITELQRERQTIDKAQKGDQVGLTFEGKGKIKEGDVLDVFKEEKVRRVV